MSTYYPKWWADPTLRRHALELKVGLRHRPSDVPKISALLQKELDRFQAWVLWYAAGHHHNTRPLILRSWTPQKDYWPVLAAYLAKHKPVPQPIPPTPPSPSAQPPSRWKNAPWTLEKWVAISHGLRKQDPTWPNIDALISQLRRSGTKAIFAQIGNDNPDPDWAENARRLYAACKAQGIPCGGWGRIDYLDYETVKKNLRSVMPLDGFQADVEEKMNDPKAYQKLFDDFGDEMPLSVVATGGIDNAFGTDAIDSAQKFGDYYDFIGQDYYKSTDPMTPDRGENFVYWRSTAKVSHGYRHLPDAGGVWHIPMGMSNAETTPSMAAQIDMFKPWKAKGWWDGEIIEANNEWGVWATA
jgi:hypothetical protein